MRNKVAVAALIFVACCSVIEQPVQAASLLQNVEKSLNRINRQLCANLPSTKCKTSKATAAHKRKAKAGPATPQPDVPTKVVPVAPVEPTEVPAVVPPLPKFRPADLKPVTAPPAVKQAPEPKSKVLAEPVPPPVQVPVPAPVQTAVPVPIPMPKLTQPAVVEPLTPPVPIIPPTSDQASACLAALAATGASFSPVPQPSTNSTCVIDTPVRINSVATKVGKVKLPDQPTVNCAYALKLSSFIDQRVQPLAQLAAGSALVAMGTGPGFDCRGRNGESSAKMSEHAIGDAVDIVYFRFADKSQILVKDALNVQSPGFVFLRDVRASACTEFKTVLGPGANAAHAEHFHMDLEVRRGGSRLCE